MADYEDVMRRVLNRENQIRTVEPGAVEEQAALGSALEASRPTTVLERSRDPQLRAEVRRRSYEDVMAGLLTRPAEGSREPPNEGDRDMALLTAGLTTGLVTQNHALTARALAQLAAMGATDYALRRSQGQERKEAFLGGLSTGGIAAGAEAVMPPALKLGGRFARFTRDGIRAARAAARTKMAKPPMPSVRRVESSAAPFAGHLEPGGADAFEAVAELGETLTPGQPVRHRYVDSLENIADASLTAGQRITEVRQSAERAVRAKLQSIVDALPSLPRGRIADTIEALHDGRLRRIKGVAHAKYRYVDEQLKPKYQTKVTRTEEVINDPKAPLTPKVVEHVTEEQILVGNGVDISELKKDVAKGIDRFSKGIIPERVNRVRRILDKPDVVDYQTAQQIRSDLFEISGQFNPNADPVLKADKALAQRMSGKLTNSIDDAARQAPPGVKEALDEANRLWREEVKGTLTDKMLIKWIRGQGEDMLDAMIRTGKPGNIRMVREIVMKEDPEAWKLVQSSFLKRVMHTTTNEFGEVQGKALKQALDSFGREDMASLNELFPGKEAGKLLANFKRYANALMFTQRSASRSGGGGGSIWFQMAQAGALAGSAGMAVQFARGESPAAVLGTGAGVATIAVLLLPGAVSRILTNPQMTRWLTVGAMHAPGTRHAARAGAVLLGAMLRDKLVAPESMDAAQELLLDFQSQLSGKERTVTPQPNARMSQDEQRMLREMKLNENPEMRVRTHRTALP